MKTNADEMDVDGQYMDINEVITRLSDQLTFSNKCVEILTKFKTFLYTHYIDSDITGSGSGVFDDHAIDSDIKTELKQLESEWNDLMLEKSCIEIICESTETITANDISEAIDNSVDTDDAVNAINESIDDTPTAIKPKRSRKSTKKISAVKAVPKRTVRRKKQMIGDLTYEFCYFPDCEFKSTRMMDISKHVRITHANNNLNKCPICEKTIKDICKFRPHVTRTHTNPSDKPYKCTEPNCNAVFKDPAGLYMHRKAHNDVKEFQCDWQGCRFETTTRSRLVSHQRIHTGERPYACEWPGCQKTCSTQSGLYNHVNITHSDKRPYKCDIDGCDAQYKYKQQLTFHKRTHTGEKPYGCDWPGCEYRSISIDKVTRHKYSHAGKRFMCTWPDCAMGYMDKFSLAAHLNKHRGIQPYACTWPECDRSFVRPEYLKAHTLKHKNEQLYCCEFAGCDKRFNYRVNMKRHFNKVHKQHNSIDASSGGSVQPIVMNSDQSALTSPPTTPTAFFIAIPVNMSQTADSIHPKTNTTLSITRTKSLRAIKPKIKIDI